MGNRSTIEEREYPTIEQAIRMKEVGKAPGLKSPRQMRNVKSVQPGSMVGSPARKEFGTLPALTPNKKAKDASSPNF